MKKKLNIAHSCFITLMTSWIVTMAITPVGGWAPSNAYCNYYMTAFCVTGILAFIAMVVCYKLEKHNK